MEDKHLFQKLLLKNKILGQILQNLQLVGGGNTTIFLCLNANVGLLRLYLCNVHRKDLLEF